MLVDFDLRKNATRLTENSLGKHIKLSPETRLVFKTLVS